MPLRRKSGSRARLSSAGADGKPAAEEWPEQARAVADTAAADPPGAGRRRQRPRLFSLNAIHILRTVQLDTLTLSQMADQKASMLMGASFVVFSIAVGRSLTGEVALVAGDPRALRLPQLAVRGDRGAAG